MNDIQAYSKAHLLKRISKRIQQLSYSLNRIEQKFDLEILEGQDLYNLIQTYEQILNELNDIYGDIKAISK